MSRREVLCVLDVWFLVAGGALDALDLPLDEGADLLEREEHACRRCGGMSRGALHLCAKESTMEHQKRAVLSGLYSWRLHTSLCDRASCISRQ